MSCIDRLLSKHLRELADRIDSGGCEMSDTEAVEIMSLISHKVMSKEDSCIYLNISKSRFDDLVRAGELPKGRKHRGFKELRWYKEDLDRYIRNKKTS